MPGPCTYHAHPQSRATLLQESFLAAGQSARILFPVNGQVFYLDETLRAGTQGIPAIVVVRTGNEASLAFDGVEIARGTALSTVTVPLVRGPHWIALTSGSASDRVAFEVK